MLNVPPAADKTGIMWAATIDDDGLKVGSSETVNDAFHDLRLWTLDNEQTPGLRPGVFVPDRTPVRVGGATQTPSTYIPWTGTYAAA